MAQVFTALRAFALCARNICVFLVVFLLSITPFVVNVVSTSLQFDPDQVQYSYTGCLAQMSFPLETPIFALDTPANDCQTLPPFPDNVSLQYVLSQFQETRN